MVDPTSAVIESGENASLLSSPTVTVCTLGVEEVVEVVLADPPPSCARANGIREGKISLRGTCIISLTFPVAKVSVLQNFID